MLLTIHIDNRTITLGGYEGEARVVSASIGTQLTATADQYAAQLHALLALRKVDMDAISGAVISSVVPTLTRTLQKAAAQLTSGRVRTVCAGMKTGLNLHLDNAGTVGADFICNAVAALDEFRPPLIVLHMESATTFALIDAAGALSGRAILPGVISGLEQLCESAAQLPNCSFDPRAKLIGRGTTDAIKAGALYGAVSMVEGMLARYEQVMGAAITVATGTVAKAILPHCSREILYRPNLLHDGLRLLYQKNA